MKRTLIALLAVGMVGALASAPAVADVVGNPGGGDCSITAGIGDVPICPPAPPPSSRPQHQHGAPRGHHDRIEPVRPPSR